jgi:hypothetical protein
MYLHVEHANVCPSYLIFINMLTCQVTPKDNDKTSRRQQDVLCIYCGRKWPNKQWLLKHWHKGYNKTPFYPNLGKRVQLSLYPNFKSTQKTKKLKHMFIDEKSTSHLQLKTKQKSMKSEVQNL